MNRLVARWLSGSRDRAGKRLQRLIRNRAAAANSPPTATASAPAPSAAASAPTQSTTASAPPPAGAVDDDMAGELEGGERETPAHDEVELGFADL